MIAVNGRRTRRPYKRRRKWSPQMVATNGRRKWSPQIVAVRDDPTNGRFV
jgi:hypothetical protein